MPCRFFCRTNISKLSFASGRTGRTAGPASSTLVKLSLISFTIYQFFFPENFRRIISYILGTYLCRYVTYIFYLIFFESRVKISFRFWILWEISLRYLSSKNFVKFLWHFKFKPDYRCVVEEWLSSPECFWNFPKSTINIFNNLNFFQKTR